MQNQSLIAPPFFIYVHKFPTAKSITNSSSPFFKIQDVPGAQVLNNTTSPPKLEFRHLCFYYDSSNPIIKDVSFTIPAGKNLFYNCQRKRYIAWLATIETTPPQLIFEK